MAAWVGVGNHADDPKGKTLELLRESDSGKAEVTSMMVGNHGLIGGE